MSLIVPGSNGRMTICVGFRGADLRERLQRRRRAIGLDAQRIDQARIGPAGADAGQGVLEHVDGLFHPFFRHPAGFRRQTWADGVRARG